ncbi:hypothetical protein ES703_39308 [subsurface metagenome]
MAVKEISDLMEFKERSGWSFEKIAGHVGVHSQTLMNWAKGSYKPSLMAREKIRKFLGEYSFL